MPCCDHEPSAMGFAHSEAHQPTCLAACAYTDYVLHSNVAAARRACVRTTAIAAPPKPSSTEQATPAQLGYTMPGAVC